MRLRVGARTDVGRVRRLNEDVYRVCERDGLFLVCDGMGGCPAGEFASALAGDAIVEHLATRAAEAPRALRPPNGYLPRTGLLAEAVRRSNARVYQHAHGDSRHAGMGTTIVGTWVADHVASVAHVGDSRAYLMDADRLIPLTRDHSLADDRFDEDRNMLARALGREPEVDVDMTEVPVRAGDYLVLCSDGLTKMVPEAAIARAIREQRHPQRICDFLVEAANRSGGVDNVTVIVIEVMASWWRSLSHSWTPHVGGTHDDHAHSAM